MKKILLIFFIITVISVSLPVCAANIVFYDLTDYGWATSAICRLAEKGIIKGTGPHSYSPGNYTSKAEYATLLSRMFELGGDGLSTFPDVEKNCYFSASVGALNALGIIQPSADGNFNPYDAITREEAMRWTGFLFERFGFSDNTDISILLNFTDGNTFSPQNVKYAAILVNSGFITGDTDGKLKPTGYLTRAETAVVLDRIYTAFYGE